MVEMNENKRSKNVNLKARKEGRNEANKQRNKQNCLIEIEHSTEEFFLHTSIRIGRLL